MKAQLSPFWLLFILTGLNLLNYLDRQMLAAMRSSIMADIPDIHTDANWGFILGSFTDTASTTNSRPVPKVYFLKIRAGLAKPNRG